MLRDLRRVGDCTVQALQVRTPDDLAACDALIIPGGGACSLHYFAWSHVSFPDSESTTIALLMRSSALEGPLQAFLKVKPVWGTCAGAILLSNAVVGAKRGGQELLRAMDVTIERNGFGSQLDSFEAPLQVGQGPNDGGRIFHGVFIRAPVSDTQPTFVQ
jgi:5'-phosphate synthase pdxT subunit